MSDEIRAKAETALAEAEVITANLLPQPAADIVTADQVTPERRSRSTADWRARHDQHPVDHQIRLQSADGIAAISSQMLDGVRNKDVGPAGASLREMVTNIAASTRMSLTPTASKAGGSVSSAPQSPSPISSRNTKMCEARSTACRMSYSNMRASSSKTSNRSTSFMNRASIFTTTSRFTSRGRGKAAHSR